MATPKANPGDTKKKGKILYRMSSSGKWFKSSDSKKANQQRSLNARLNAPIASFQGPTGTITSPTTERNLAHEANAATNVKYGDARDAVGAQLGAAQSQLGGANYWFNDYRAKLATWRQQIADQQAQAVAAAQALPGMVQGLGQQQQGVVQQQQAQQNALTGGVANPQLAADANQANQATQAIGANWAGLAQNNANARNAYASGIENVVAPAQQQVAIQGANAEVNKALSKKASLASQEGDFNQSYRTGRRTDEAKTLLAESSLGLKGQTAAAADKTANRRITTTAKSAAAARRDARAKENTRHAEAMAKATTDSEKLAETKRHNRAMEAAKTAKAKKGKSPEWVTSNEQNSGLTQAVSLRDLASKAKAGHPFVAGHGPQRPASRNEAKTKIMSLGKISKGLKSPALLSAALDAAYDGHLSAYTVRKLIDARYKPSVVAKSLGVPTKGQQKGYVRKPGKATSGSRSDGQ